jgi:hypothetical protein
MNSNPDMVTRNKRKLPMHARKQSDTGWLIWDRQISNAGYARIMLRTDDGNKILSAPRAARQLFIDPLGNDEIVTQSFRNSLRINPFYLATADQIPLDYWYRLRH